MKISSFQPPFHVSGGEIRDARGRYVTLWGVNYYAPFNHNFYNIAELGKEHFRAVDEDLDHLQLLGVDFLRLHMYEREITDPAGNLVENANLRVFDYLVEQCEKRNIFLMIAPISYWNSVQNQLEQERLYAYWNIGAQEAFGFTNFYSIDALLWHPEALACQERYFRSLFSHRNAFSGKLLREYRNLVVWELVNEMQFPDRRLLRPEPRITAENMIEAIWSRGPLRREFQEHFRAFRADLPEAVSEEEAFGRFLRQMTDDYFRRFWGMSNDYFQGSVLNSQFYSYNGTPPEALHELLESSPWFDTQSVGNYLNAHGFDSVNTDDANHLALADRHFERLAARTSKRPLIAYEFDASCTQNGYPLAALAAMYAANRVQLAAYFTYTPSAVAAWNPGWLVHYLNIAHTPARAAAFRAAGEIFRHCRNGSLCRTPEEWSSENFLIRRQGDRVLYRDRECYCHSGDCSVPPVDPASLRLVCGRGSSPLVSCDGNGIYMLRHRSGSVWEFSLFPAQRYLREPARGRAFLSMANRFVSCLREQPVSQLSERPLRLRFPLFETVRCTCRRTGREYLAEAGEFQLPSGEYLLEAARKVRNS